MKELSIEQKAKAYDEAIERAKIWKDKSGMPKDKQGILDDIFPELTESEDERIRKALRERIINYDPNNEILIKEEGISQRQFLAWLEKQNQDLEKLKLEKGKWYFCIEDYHPRANCTDFYQGEKYRCEKDGVMGVWRIKNPEKYFRECKTPTYAGSDSVRIQSIIQVLEYARSLSAYNQFGKDDITKDIAWLKKQEKKVQGKSALEAAQEEKVDNQNCVKSYAQEHIGDKVEPKSTDVQEVDFFDDFRKTDSEVEPKFRAGDKVIGIISGIQYYIIKVCDNHYCTESGCIIMFCAQDNFELVEQQLKEIEQKPTDEEMKRLLQTEYEKGRADAITEMQKSWSEEDEAKLKSILFHIEDVENKDVIDWLKSLKDKVQPKQEWSEEDEKRLQSCLNVLQPRGIMGVTETINTKWLKSLKDRHSWKPTTEQLRELHCVISGCSFETSILVELEENLKKLL